MIEEEIMGEKFLEELANTANLLIEMLADCEMNVIEYVTSQVTDNGYVFLDDLQELDKERIKNESSK